MKLVGTGVRYLRVVEKETFQIGEAAQVLQTGVGDLRVVKV